MNAEKGTTRKNAKRRIHRQRRRIGSWPYNKKKERLLRNYSLPYCIEVKPQAEIDLLLNCGRIREVLLATLRVINKTAETHEVVSDIPIFKAVKQFNGDMGKISGLLEDISMLTEKHENVLHAAVTSVGDPKHSKDLVEFLVRQKPDLVNQTEVFRKTPLHFAIKCGANKDLIRVLLDHGASPHAIDNVGNTPLHYAAEHHPDVIALLLAYGARVNAVNHFQETALCPALMHALVTNHLKGIEDLLSAGARINGPDLAFVHYSDCDKLLGLFLSYGADPDKMMDQTISFPDYKNFELLMACSLFRRFRNANGRLSHKMPGGIILVATQEEKNKMTSFIQSCIREIHQMANDPIHGGSSLYQFLCENYPASRSESTYMIPDHILLKVHHYPCCKELILLLIPLEALIRRARTLPIHCTTDDTDEKIYFNSLCVDHLLKYLKKKEDLLNLILAFMSESPNTVMH